MSDNKKYYYLKLKDTFFDSEEMKVIESMPNGAIYQNVYLKMCLLSLKSEGALTFKDIMPYDIQMLSTVLRQNIDTVKTAVELFVKLGLVSITDTETMYMTDIQSLIGRSSTEADRVKAYRERIKDNETPQIECTKSVQMYENCTPEKEIEIELKKEIEFKDIDKDTEDSSNSLSEDDFDKLFPLNDSDNTSKQSRRNFNYFKKTNAFLDNYFKTIQPKNKESAERMVTLFENRIKTVKPKFHFANNAKGNEEYELLEFSRKQQIDMSVIEQVLNNAIKDEWWGPKIISSAFFIKNYTQIAMKFSDTTSKRTSPDINVAVQDFEEEF